MFLSQEDIKTFDDFEEGLKLMRIVSATKDNLLKKSNEEIYQVKELDRYLKAEAQELGNSLEKVLAI